METECPNCGYRLVSHRTDRQAVGQREVVMHWNICRRCRHVALQYWFFDDMARPERRASEDRSRTRRRIVPLRSMKAPGGM